MLITSLKTVTNPIICTPLQRRILLLVALANQKEREVAKEKSLPDAKDVAWEDIKIAITQNLDAREVEECITISTQEDHIITIGPLNSTLIIWEDRNQ